MMAQEQGEVPPPEESRQLLEAALHYAEVQKWQVFPCWWPEGRGCRCGRGETCERPGKHPLGRLVPNGLLDATSDPDVITGWWRQYPKANIGIRCGAESGILVLDVDAYKTGRESLDALEAKYGALPYGLRAYTGSGGGSMHIVLLHPKDGRRVSSNSSGKLGPGLDIKADGGYIIAAPSLHISGGRYTWVDEDDSRLEPAPEWFLDLLGRYTPPAEHSEYDGTELDDQHAEPLCEKLFARASERVASGAARHDTAVWLWTQFKDNAVPKRIAQTFKSLYLDLCRESGVDRPVTDEEMDAVINWAYSQPRREPFPSVAEVLLPKKVALPPAPADATTPMLPLVTAERFRERARVLAETAIPTGIPSLDKVASKKGGLGGGTVLTFIGAAGSCKTALAFQIGLDRARAEGKKCYAYTPDQGAFQPLDRIAETCGDVENDDEAFARFEEVMQNFCIVDETADGVSLERFVAMVEASTDCGVVIIDTPQTVESETEEQEFPRIALAFKMAKRLADKMRIPILLPSHTTRAASAARKVEERTRELTAGYGGTKVEHRSQIILNMEPKGEAVNSKQILRCAISKGVRGRVGQFFLEIDYSTWRLIEMDELPPETLPEDTIKKQRDFDGEIWDIVAHVLKRGEVDFNLSRAKAYVARRFNASGRRISPPAIVEAIYRLEAEGRLFLNQGKRGSINLALPKDLRAERERLAAEYESRET